MAKDTEVNIDVVGTAEAVRGLDADWASVREGSLSAIRKTVTSIQGRVKRSFGTAGRPNWITRNLSRSIKTRVDPGAEKITGIVFVDAQAPYGAGLEFGTQPHVILPRTPLRIVNGKRKGGVLHFVSSSGEDVFATRVNHPGNPPMPFMRPALKEEQPDIPKRFRKEIEKALRKRKTKGAA